MGSPGAFTRPTFSRHDDPVPTTADPIIRARLAILGVVGVSFPSAQWRGLVIALPAAREPRLSGDADGVVCIAAANLGAELRILARRWVQRSLWAPIRPRRGRGRR